LLLLLHWLLLGLLRLLLLCLLLLFLLLCFDLQQLRLLLLLLRRLYLSSLLLPLFALRLRRFERGDFEIAQTHRFAHRTNGALEVVRTVRKQSAQIWRQK
jgi:hypothetical protein